MSTSAILDIGILNDFTLDVIVSPVAVQGQIMPSASKGIPIQMFPSRIDNTHVLLKGTTIAIPTSCTNVRIHVIHEGTGSGTLVIEETFDPTDVRGTFNWSILATIDLSNISADSEQVIHIAGSFSFVRARITSALAGGAAYVYLVCN